MPYWLNEPTLLGRLPTARLGLCRLEREQQRQPRGERVGLGVVEAEFGGRVVVVEDPGERVGLGAEEPGLLDAALGDVDPGHPGPAPGPGERVHSSQRARLAATRGSMAGACHGTAAGAPSLLGRRP